MLIQVDKKTSQRQQYQAFIDALAYEAKNGIKLKQLLYERKRRQQLGRANQGAAGYVEGLGQLDAQYDLDMWFQAIHFGDRYHWGDESSIEQYKKDNPEVLVTR